MLFPIGPIGLPGRDGPTLILAHLPGQPSITAPLYTSPPKLQCVLAARECLVQSGCMGWKGQCMIPLWMGFPNGYHPHSTDCWPRAHQPKGVPEAGVSTPKPSSSLFCKASQSMAVSDQRFISIADVSPLKKKLFETPKLVDTSIAKDLQPWSLNSLNFNSDDTLTPLANHLIIWVRSLHIPERSQGLHGFTPWSPAVVQTCRNHMILLNQVTRVLSLDVASFGDWYLNLIPTLLLPKQNQSQLICQSLEAYLTPYVSEQFYLCLYLRIYICISYISAYNDT